SAAAMPASAKAAPAARTIRLSTSSSGWRPKGVWPQPTMQAVIPRPRKSLGSGAAIAPGARTGRIAKRFAADRATLLPLGYAGLGRQALREAHRNAAWRPDQLVLAHDDSPAQDRRLAPAGHAPPVERC